FKVNSKFTSQKLVELAKMDGAIILSKDLKKILYANVFLFPSVHLTTKETGTRHKAAERTAKHLDTITIAISERKSKITIYSGESKYELGESSEILRRAAETLQVLEKQKEMLNQLMINLNILELTNLVTTTDVCNVLQRLEMIRRISNIIKRYLIELGNEGIIISMRLRELLKNLKNDRLMILKDYFGARHVKIDTLLKNINFGFLIEVDDILEILFKDFSEEHLCCKGIRLLNEARLDDKEIKLLTNKFQTLDEIFNANKDVLVNLFKDEEIVFSLKKNLENLGEKILARKNI
ncbi:MAG: DNA integrity scanning diadenylate cyclase DisA, partial [Nanoarchaeota archaeon]